MESKTDALISKDSKRYIITEPWASGLIFAVCIFVTIIVPIFFPII